MFEDEGFSGVPKSPFVRRSISAPPTSDNAVDGQLPSSYSNLLSGEDISDRYFSSSETSRSGPRMPKPVRSNGDFSVGFVAGQFFDTGDDIHGLDSVLEDVNRSLLVDSKPKTPMDLIQADFPSTPSSVYSNRLRPKQQETSRFVTTQDDHSPPMSPSPAAGVSRLQSQSPTSSLKGSSSSTHLDRSSIDGETAITSPLKARDYGPSSSDVDQITVSMSVMHTQAFPPPQNGAMQQQQHQQHHHPSHGYQYQMQQQQMMQQSQQMRGAGYVSYGGNYGGQAMGMQQHQYPMQTGAYMNQEPVLGAMSPSQYYHQQQSGMYGNQMYNYSMSGTGMNNGGGGVPFPQPARGMYGDASGYLMYPDPHQPMQQQQHWDHLGNASGMDDNSSGSGQSQGRPSNGMIYPQHQQMMPTPHAMYGGAGGMQQQMQAGLPQPWNGGGPPMPSHSSQQQASNHVAGSSVGNNGGPMLYSQTLIQGIGSNGNDNIRNVTGNTSPRHTAAGNSSVKDPRRQGGMPLAPVGNNIASSGRGVAGRPTVGGGKNAPGGPGSSASSVTGSTSSSSGSRDPLVEEFRNTFGKSKQWEIKDLVGHIVAFCQDQHGSRFIQQRLEVVPDAEKQLVFDELVPCAQSLMTDVFGNYVIQKLFEFGSPDQCEMLASMLMGQAVTLAMQMYGCRVIQKALEYVCTDRLVALVGEFEGQQVLRCVHDQNGNHVIQKCIEVVCRVSRDSQPATAEYLSSKIQFIISAFHGRVRELSMHPYGCRVVQRILEHCPNSQKAPVLEELRKCCNELVQDQYGNYVIQHVMQHGWDKDKAMLIREVQSHLLDYSQHKFASNVVEKCLQFANRIDRDEMIWTIINVTFDMNSPVDVNTGQCVLESMVRDPYANYVVQKVIDVSDERQRGAIVRYVKENIVQLRRYTYGKHIIVRLEKVCNEKF